MAEREEIATLIGTLRGKIDILKRTLEPDSALARMISNVEIDLHGLETRYAAAPAGEDLTPLRTALEDLDKVLSRIIVVQTPSQSPPRSRLERALTSLGQSGPSLGLIALAIVCIL